DLNGAREALIGRTDLAKVEPSRLKKHAKAVLIVVIAIMAVAYGLYKFAIQKRAVFIPPNLEISRLTATGKVSTASISPDGKHVVYAVDESGKQSIWIREVETPKISRSLSPRKPPTLMSVLHVTVISSISTRRRTMNPPHSIRYLP